MAIKKHSFHKSRLSLFISIVFGTHCGNADVITVSDQCSLIDAILAANQDTPVGGCNKGSGEDIIELPQGKVFSYQEPYTPGQTNGNGLIELNALPLVRESLAINGNGSVIERVNSSDKEFRLIGTTLEFPPKQIQLTLNDLTLRNGLLVSLSNDIEGICGGAIKADFMHKVVLNNSTVTQNKAGSGGGICGSVELNNATVSHNIATSKGGGVALNFGEIIEANHSSIVNNLSYSTGGGIASTTAQVNINDSTISGNSATSGAGFSSGSSPGRRGSLDPYCRQSLVQRSVISGNMATQNGGGIRETCTLKVVDSIVENNKAVDGAGIYLHPNGHADLIGSTISTNTASGNGGGIYGAVEAINSTISNNTAQKGGGFFGEPTFIHSTITENQADQAAGVYISVLKTDGYIFLDSFQIVNSVIANNTGQDCMFNPNLDGVFNKKLSFEPNLNNWFGDSSCDGNASGNPLIAGLADNGGLTLTHALLPDSPLMNAANISFCLNTASDQDQRGIQRFDNLFCDIGAYEVANTSEPSVPELPIILVNRVNINHMPKRVDFSSNQTFHQPPVIILGPLSYNGSQPATTRITQIDTSGFSLKVQEYNYLDGFHVTESTNFLAIPPGLYQLTDNQGTTIIIEAGFIELGAASWKKHVFNADFPQIPILFTTVQTDNGKDAVTERIRLLDKKGFFIRLFEEERLNPGGHIKERLGYVAIHSSKPESIIPVNGENLELKIIPRFKLTHIWQAINGIVRLKIEEEQSLDAETSHVIETINMVTIGPHVFAEDISGHGYDTSTIRKLQ